MFYIAVVFSFILYPSLCSISSFIKSLHFVQFVIHIIACGFVVLFYKLQVKPRLCL